MPGCTDYDDIMLIRLQVAVKRVVTRRKGHHGSRTGASTTKQDPVGRNVRRLRLAFDEAAENVPAADMSSKNAAVSALLSSRDSQLRMPWYTKLFAKFKKTASARANFITGSVC